MERRQRGLCKRNKGIQRKHGIKRHTPLKARPSPKGREGKTGYFSIFTDDMRKCYVTGAKGRVEVHHIFGASDKASSEKYGFMLPLRADWHRTGDYSIHMDRGFSVRMKMECQEYYVNTLGKSQEEWRREFRKWYTEEDMGKKAAREGFAGTGG